ncbi:MAG: hypothetical protein IIX30_03230, partial [Clostridia bacterium]|nr:hypothetical protein [Clostridia bacterium]
ISKTASVRFKTLEITAQRGTSRVLTNQGMEHFVNNTFGTEDDEELGTKENNIMLLDESRHVQRPTGPADAPAIPTGYEYLYIGSDQISEYCSAHAHTTQASNFLTETPVYTDAVDGFSLYVHAAHNRFGNLWVPRVYLQDGRVVETTKTLARWDHVQNFTLTNRLGQIATTYCADKDTGAEEGFAYNIYNISDADYYSAEAAAMYIGFYSKLSKESIEHGKLKDVIKNSRKAKK